MVPWVPVLEQLLRLKQFYRFLVHQQEVALGLPSFSFESSPQQFLPPLGRFLAQQVLPQLP
jgi:hypothetical protein